MRLLRNSIVELTKMLPLPIPPLVGINQIENGKNLPEGILILYRFNFSGFVQRYRGRDGERERGREGEALFNNNGTDEVFH